MIWLFIILIIIIIYVEALPLYKTGAYNELIVFGVFLCLGLYLAMAQVYHAPFYSVLSEWANRLAYP